MEKREKSERERRRREEEREGFEDRETGRKNKKTHLRVTPEATSEETNPAKNSELVKSCKTGESNLQ